VPDAVLQGLANSVADQYGIPQNIFGALITHESSWNPNATGSSGEAGLTQLLPSTSAMLGVTNPYDPLQNLQGGASYLSSLYKRFGDWFTALAAYNAGPNNVQAGYGYAQTVLGLAGVTNANAPGPQTVPGNTNLNSIQGGSSTTGTTSKTSATPSLIVYGLAILVVLMLVAFGVWGVMKG